MAKFKVGDYIKDDNYCGVIRITEITDQNYEFYLVENTTDNHYYKEGNFFTDMIVCFDTHPNTLLPAYGTELYKALNEV